MHVVKRRSLSKSGPTESGPETHRPFLLCTTSDLLSTDDPLPPPPPPPSPPPYLTTTQPTYLLATVVHWGLTRYHWGLTGFDWGLTSYALGIWGHPRATSRWWQPLWKWIAILTFLRMIKVCWTERWLDFEGLRVMITNRGRWHLGHLAFQ